MSSQTGTLPPEGVRRMFDRIAPVYDSMNRLMTAGLDRRWRRETAAAVVRPGDKVLDVCCGTGDLALAAEQAGGKVTGLDFSEPMLERARAKSPELEWMSGDALALPFADGSFDAVTIGFGLRNLAEADEGLQEMRRVLRPGRAARDPRDHAPPRPARALLPPLVRRRDPPGRQGPPGRVGLLVPARERSPLSRIRRGSRS